MFPSISYTFKHISPAAFLSLNVSISLELKYPFFITLEFSSIGLPIPTTAMFILSIALNTSFIFLSCLSIFIIFSFDTIAGPCNNLNFPPIPLLSSTTNWFECVVISASPIPPTSGINSILLNLFTLAYCGIIFKVVPIETPIISPSCIILYKYLATSAPNSSF